MASKYEEMCAVAEQARKNWLATSQRLMQHMALLAHGLVTYCAIPPDRVRYLRFNAETSAYEEPGNGGNYFLMGAMSLEDDGLCRLGICVLLTPHGTFPARWASFGLSVHEESGKVIAKLSDKGKPYSVDSNQVKQEFYETVVENIKREFSEPHETRESIGFKVNPPQSELPEAKGAESPDTISEPTAA